MNPVSLNKDLLLPIQRQMVAAFASQNVRQQSRRGQSPIQQPFGQRRDQRRTIHVNAMNILAPDSPAAQKTRRFKIQLPAWPDRLCLRGVRLSVFMAVCPLAHTITQHLSTNSRQGHFFYSRKESS
jgi:hypothetical protein